MQSLEIVVCSDWTLINRPSFPVMKHYCQSTFPSRIDTNPTVYRSRHIRVTSFTGFHYNSIERVTNVGRGLKRSGKQLSFSNLLLKMSQLVIIALVWTYTADIDFSSKWLDWYLRKCWFIRCYALICFRMGRLFRLPVASESIMYSFAVVWCPVILHLSYFTARCYASAVYRVSSCVCLCACLLHAVIV